MKPPTCKVCQKAHWTYEGHFVSEVTVPAYIKEMARGALGRERVASEEGVGAVDVGGHQKERTHFSSASVAPSSVAAPSRSTCNACNKPLHNRGKVCNACRQRAYRERNK